MFKLVGDTYGSKMLDLELVPKGSTVISAGIGEEISFDLELIKEKDCQIVGVDPTEKAANFISSTKPDNFTFLRKALYTRKGKVDIFKNSNSKYVSESTLMSHNMVSDKSYKAATVTIPQLLKKYPDTSVLKMDIEGSEYDVLYSLDRLEVPQICCEFHHFCTEYTIEDTKTMILHLKKLGYEFYVPKQSTETLAELTFVHNTCL